MVEKKEGNYKFIYSYLVAKDLLKLGFNIVDLRIKGIQNDRKIVFVFKNTKELQSALEVIQIKIEQHKLEREKNSTN